MFEEHQPARAPTEWGVVVWHGSERKAPARSRTLKGALRKAARARRTFERTPGEPEPGARVELYALESGDGRLIVAWLARDGRWERRRAP